MKQTGFTLLELIIALVIVGIVATIALPAYNGLIADNKVSSTANNVIGAFNLARAEATKRGTTVNISSVSGDTAWTGGYRIWIDTNASGGYNAGEEIRVFEAIDNSLTLTGDSEGSAFSAVGFLTGFLTASVATQTLTLCTSETGVADRQLTVALSGRINISEITCP